MSYRRNNPMPFEFNDSIDIDSINPLAAFVSIHDFDVISESMHIKLEAQRFCLTLGDYAPNETSSGRGSIPDWILQNFRTQQEIEEQRAKTTLQGRGVIVYSGRTKPLIKGGFVQYPEFSQALVELFRAAITYLKTKPPKAFPKGIDIPESWASSNALHNIVARESHGVVGKPNFLYGDRAKDPNEWPKIWDELRRGLITSARGPKGKSSATGIGQLLSYNAANYYPSGLDGIGNALDEAAGMLAYIKARYSTPEKAWAAYTREGY
jgi:hypothetical protein